MNRLQFRQVKYKLGEHKHSHAPHIIMGVLTVVLIIGITIFWLQRDKTAAPAVPDTQNAQDLPLPVEPAPIPTEDEKPQEFDAKAIQAAVTSWVKGHKGTYSVVVSNPETEKVLATSLPDKSYFTASIYKLYVAYEGYRKVDDGTYSLSDPYLSGWTRGKCLDQMIRVSHSPCAEKMWAELGKENLNTQMKKYGLTNTSMTGLSTTAEDAAIMLTRIQKGEGLSEKSQKSFMDSMKGQIYRDGLPAGFTTATVYDKVGFNGKVEYHDTAIVKLKDGRILIVSVLTQNAGTKNIAGLATAIQTAVQ